VSGQSLSAYARLPERAADGSVTWRDMPETSSDETVLRTAAAPFSPTGGLKLLAGNLGRAVIKVSAVPEDRHTVEAPARIFDSQEAMQVAFKNGELERDVVVVVRFQGPQANGMPELHKLTPPLAVLQGKGFKVALVTDGRMSGASGKVPAAIHVTPEALGGGMLARLRDGDMVRLCANKGSLETDADLDAREAAPPPPPAEGMGRELFALFRALADGAERGASPILAAGGL
jgi:phosphogluconate dehydratase